MSECGREIMSPGIDLDARVSEVIFGHTDEYPPTGCLCGIGDWCATCMWPAIPGYSTTNEYAHNVIDRMRRRGFEFLYGTTAISPVGVMNQNWACFGRHGTLARYVVGESFAHAVCLAALDIVKHEAEL